MTGSIRTKEKCPDCGQSFKHILRVGMRCPAHERHPEKYFIRIYIPGHGKKEIWSDGDGQPLDSYGRAFKLLAAINHEIDTETFDPTHYIRQEAEKFWSSALLEKFRKEKVPQLAPSYQTQYETTLKRAAKVLGTRDVRRLRKRDMKELKEHFEDSGLAPKTVKNNLMIVRTWLNWVKSDEQIIQSLPDFPEIEVPESNPRWLPVEEQMKIFARFPVEDRPIISFLMYYGCRIGEARAVKVEDVIWPRRTVEIKGTFSDNVYRPRRKGKKSKPYIVALCGPPDLEAYIEKRLSETTPAAWLFVNPRTGDCYYESALRKLWNKVRKSLGLSKDLKLYDATRHSVASQMVAEGSSLAVVQQQLGHSDLRTTMKYAHIDIETRRLQLEKLAAKKIIPWGGNGGAAEKESNNSIKISTG